MATYGLTAEGLRIKSRTVILEEMRAELRGLWGASFDLSDSSPDGQLLGIVAAEVGLLWQLAQAVHSSNSRDSATGAALDAVLLLSGTLRPEATYSAVTLTLTGDDGTPVLSGSRAKSASVATTIFQTTADAALELLDAWAPASVYAVDYRVYNAGRSYVCITAGTSAGSGGPTTTAADITDGSAHWRYLGEGTAAVDVAARASVTGPVIGVSGDLTVIDTPVGGWSSVINLLDAELGRDVASDAEARVQGEADLARAGATTPDAIRETLLAVDGVTSVTPFFNATDITDGEGVPPHSVECMVQGGADQDVINAIGSSCVAAGIGTYCQGTGAVTGAWLDSQGVSHVVKFSRPTLKPIWAIVTLVKKAYSASDPLSYPLDGDDQCKAAIVRFGDAQLCGKNAVASQVGAQVFQRVDASNQLVGGVAGVFDVTQVLIGLINPPVATTTIPVGSRELATWDTSRIAIITSDGTP